MAHINMAAGAVFVPSSGCSGSSQRKRVLATRSLVTTWVVPSGVERLSSQVRVRHYPRFAAGDRRWNQAKSLKLVNMDSQKHGRNYRVGIGNLIGNLQIGGSSSSTCLRTDKKAEALRLEPPRQCDNPQLYRSTSRRFYGTSKHSNEEAVVDEFSTAY
ncbi:unnamed protein product, partial [Amoebophrya sp. A25]|eukprot:GSA25T00010440001.1